MARKVVVMLKGYLGDAVMAIPLLETLKAVDGTVATNHAIEALLKPSFPKLRFLQVTAHGPLRDFENARKLRGFDVAIVVNRSFRAALTARLAGVPIRVGHSVDGRSFLLTRPLPYDEERNEAECYVDLGEAAGLARFHGAPLLNLSDEERAEGLTRLSGATVGIQPGARHSWKQIPAPALIETAQWLSSQGCQIALFGGSEEVAAAAQLTSALPTPPLNLVGKLAMRESAAALSGLRLAIGGDTGVMHLAAAVGCPTITAFGPTKAAKWGHYEPPHQVVQAEHGDISRINAQQLIEAAARVLGRP